MTVLTQETAARKPSVFVVEDEGLISMELSDRLTHLGYEVRGSAARGEEALESIRQHHPDLVLMDIRLAGSLSGIETAAKLRESCDIPVIYLTAYCDDELLQEAAVTEPYGYLLKPFDELELHATIKMALNKRRAEQKLRQTEELFRSAVDLWEQAVAILGSDGRVLAKNRGFTKACGGRSIIEAVAPTDQPVLKEALARAAAGTAATVRSQLNRNGEDPAPGFEIRLQPLAAPGGAPDQAGRLLCLCRDLNEVPSSSPQTGAAGAETFAVELSHHLNNLLTIIVGNAEVAEKHLPLPPSGHPAGSSATNIIDAAADAEILIQRLIESSGHAPVTRQLIRLDEILEEALAEVATLIPAQTAIERKIDPACPAVTGDREQLRRVMVELIANAWQALEGSGTIKIQVREAKGRSASPEAVPGQRYTALSIADHGTGMDKATAARIFEPFFTTHSLGTVFSGRAIGQGAGLGLAVVRGIVKAHGGFVTVLSQPNQGSLFTIFLPVASEL